MPSQPFLIAAIVIISVVVLAILLGSFLYKLFTGKSANLACKEFASQIKVSFFHPLLSFMPFTPICDIVAPF